ncbi:MAG TPA: hypothetical protein VLV55_06560 [Rhizomicrobium sp.]|nr:hypothetical protein [Rhizomicrobium sp.]
MSSIPVIFVSIGTPLSKQQLEFKIAIMNCVRGLGFEPRTVGDREEDTDSTHIRPWDHAVGILKSCDGAVVVAYEKDRASTLTRNKLDGTSTSSNDVRLMTVWNHAEASIAYSIGLPLLLLCERGVKQEGMLEERVLGHVADIEISPEQLSSSVFQNRLEAWAKEVRLQAGRPKRIMTDSFDSISLAELWSLIVRLKVSTIVAVLSVVGGLITAAFLLGRWFGSLH